MRARWSIRLSAVILKQVDYKLRDSNSDETLDVCGTVNKIEFRTFTETECITIVERDGEECSEAADTECTTRLENMCTRVPNQEFTPKE